MYELRWLEESGPHDVKDLPIMGMGTHTRLRRVVEKRGYVWVSVPEEPHGNGYFVHPPSGDVLYLVPQDRLTEAA